MTTIVYLHGMAGSHLTRADGGRAWIGAWPLMRGSLGADLQGTLNPAGHVKLFHRPAAWYWRARGMRVVEFSYDWRLSLDHAAAALARLVTSLPAGRLVIAAHSMGGCVACRFASLFPEPAARIDRAFFFGVPLRGTFSAAEVLLGSFRLPRLVARASFGRQRADVETGIRDACAAMPGLIDLLPDPALFPSAALLYCHENWDTRRAPAQAMLDRSLVLKRELRESPILRRTTVLGSSLWSTSAGVELREGNLQLSAERLPGDGVTTLASATETGHHAPPLPIHSLAAPHAFLLFEPSGIGKVCSSMP